MKQLLYYTLLLVASFGFSQDLFFSEYAEGSSNNKYLEIYNPTSSEIDLSGYAYPSVANAPTTAGEHEYWNEFDTSATIPANGVYVIAHPSADASILAKADETHSKIDEMMTDVNKVRDELNMAREERKSWMTEHNNAVTKSLKTGAESEEVNSETKGKYMVASVCHRVTPDSSTTSLSLVRDSFGGK